MTHTTLKSVEKNPVKKKFLSVVAVREDKTLFSFFTVFFILRFLIRKKKSLKKRESAHMST